jgi:F0F1-type ATP synthase membrane subunit c/vacuolar-type H+-ATPase subunit K
MGMPVAGSIITGPAAGLLVGTALVAAGTPARKAGDRASRPTAKDRDTTRLFMLQLPLDLLIAQFCRKLK